MSSIITNAPAIAALQTLRAVTSSLQQTQSHVSSGLRVQKASDNAAYWSIATTMRSDNKALSAASDALGMGQAKVDAAYTGLSSVLEVMSEFKAKLVSAIEAGVDKTKVQAELDQLKQHVVSIANSASFNGQNWLNTDIEDIYDVDRNGDRVITSFTRDASGGVAVLTANQHLSETSLFNANGGGLLQKDGRDVDTIGGMRYLATFTSNGEIYQQWMPAFSRGSAGAFTFNFSGPLVFNDPTDQISFDVTVDKDNPADGIDPPFDLGKTTSVTIDRATVDAVNPAWNGIVSTYAQYYQVLSHALSSTHTGASAALVRDFDGAIIPNLISIGTNEDRTLGLNGSYVEISNFVTNGVSGGGLGNAFNQGTRGSTLNLSFTDFQDYKDGDDKDGISISFSFGVNSEAAKSYSFNRTYVNDVLGVKNGKIETADQMVTLLKSLLSADWPSLQIESSSSSSVTLKTDPALDRLAGSDSGIAFSGISVSNEPLPTINFMEIDIAKNPAMVSEYLTYIEISARRITSGAAELGSLHTRLEMQSAFADQMMNDIDSGIGRLADADMEEEASRLTALQTQQQLALQSLSIANNSPRALLDLFNR
ncbi:flagellin N-terminal helical domain-containing protein [Rhizobium yanglingense]